MTSDQFTPVPDDGSRPIVDRSVLAEWLGDDDAAINALLLVFRDSICLEYNRLTDVLVADDLDAFAKTAHRLRGAAMAMGAHAIAETAGHLEEQAKASDRPSCYAGLQNLEGQVRLMVQEVPAGPAQPGPAG